MALVKYLACSPTVEPDFLIALDFKSILWFICLPENSRKHIDIIRDGVARL